MSREAQAQPHTHLPSTYRHTHEVNTRPHRHPNNIHRTQHTAQRRQYTEVAYFARHFIYSRNILLIKVNGTVRLFFWVEEGTSRRKVQIETKILVFWLQVSNELPRQQNILFFFSHLSFWIEFSKLVYKLDLEQNEAQVILIITIYSNSLKLLLSFFFFRVKFFRFEL